MTMILQSSYPTMPPIAATGVLSGDTNKCMPAKNADTVSMPFGMPVAFKPSGTTSDYDVIVPAGSTQQIKGIVVRGDIYDRTWSDNNGNVVGDIDSVGLVPGTMFDVVTDGVIWVTSTTACKPGDRLFVSFAAGSVYTAAGQIGNVTDTNAIDCTNQAQFQSTAAAGGLAMIKCSFTNVATTTSTL